MALTCARCDGSGFLNLRQIPDAEMAATDGKVEKILAWMKAQTEPRDVQVCDCCGDGEGWHGIPGEHYNIHDRPGSDAYNYNGGLCECH